MIHFRLRLYVIEKTKYCMDLTRSISKFPYLKFSLLKWLFDNTIDFVLLTLTSKPHLAQYPCSLSRHRCNPSFDVDIRSRSFTYDILLKEMFSNTMGSHSAKISCRSFWKIFDSRGLMLGMGWGLVCWGLGASCSILRHTSKLLGCITTSLHAVWRVASRQRGLDGAKLLWCRKPKKYIKVIEY